MNFQWHPWYLSIFLVACGLLFYLLYDTEKRREVEWLNIVVMVGCLIAALIIFVVT